jgi:hypothetical protein
MVIANTAERSEPPSRVCHTLQSVGCGAGSPCGQVPSRLRSWRLQQPTMATATTAVRREWHHRVRHTLQSVVSRSDAMGRVRWSVRCSGL